MQSKRELCAWSQGICSPNSSKCAYPVPELPGWAETALDIYGDRGIVFDEDCEFCGKHKPKQAEPSKDLGQSRLDA